MRTFRADGDASLDRSEKRGFVDELSGSSEWVGHNAALELSQ
jgi:hypothetical protein